MKNALPLLALLLVACGGDSADEEAAPADEPTSGAEAEPAQPTMPLAEGTEAPGFTLQDQTGAERSLASERGHYVVLYFYPRDATPGCTTEACGFRDAWERYEERGITLFGVSVDDVASHAAFAEEHELPFALLADVDHDVSGAYGVLTQQGDTAYSRRVTYVIDDTGVIRHTFEDVDPGVHADEVLDRIDALRLMGQPPTEGEPIEDEPDAASE